MALESHNSGNINRSRNICMRSKSDIE